MQIKFYNIAEKPTDVPFPNIPDLVQPLRIHPTVKASQIVVIGQGGSVSGLKALVGALPHNSEVYIVDTVDPDYIHEIQNKVKKDRAFVVVISKSGETATVLEAASFFIDLPFAIISTKGSSLWQLGEKVGAQLLEHPPLGGRFTALSLVDLFPAALAGMDTEAIVSGGLQIFQTHGRENLAWKTALALYNLEQKRYVELLVALYSKGLSGFGPYITQLWHETLAKDGVGQSVIAAEGPELQHHTNQRYFGGRKNMVLVLITQAAFFHNPKIKFPANVHSVVASGHTLASWQGRSLSKSLEAEFTGVLEQAKAEKRPVIHIELPALGPVQTGQLLAFWQLVAIYSAVLRSVDPYTQPQVEASKKRAIDLRFS